MSGFGLLPEDIHLDQNQVLELLKAKVEIQMLATTGSEDLVKAFRELLTDEHMRLLLDGILLAGVTFGMELAQVSFADAVEQYISAKRRRRSGDKD